MALKWLTTFITDRTTLTLINNTSSNILSVITGVPQGSILGPILFCLFINDLPSHISNPTFLYADDSTICVSDNKSNDTVHLQTKITNTLNQLNSWITKNKMVLNYDKTKIMYFNSPSEECKIDNYTIQPVTTFKLLGIYIDNKLKWSYHITHLCSKVKRYIHIFKHIRSKLNYESKKLLYQSLIQSILQYCILIYCTSSKTNLHNLQVFQNKVIKCIFNLHYLTDTKLLYSQLSIMHIHQLYTYSIIKFI